MPLEEASPATTASGMLSQENRMPTHGSLLAVVRYDSRSKSFCHKVLCVFSYRRQSLFHYILPVLLGQMEPAAKIRLCQSLKEIRQVILCLITRNAFLRLFLLEQRWIYVFLGHHYLLLLISNVISIYDRLPSI